MDKVHTEKIRKIKDNRKKVRNDMVSMKKVRNN